MPASQQANRRRRINGDGSVYKCQDGYWVGAFYARTTAGTRKRVVVYGKTLDEAQAKLGKAQQEARNGIPVPDQSWKVGPYLDYWLENFVKNNKRPATYALYEMITRIYLKPGLGSRRLTGLTVPMVQQFLSGRLQKGDSVRKVQVTRTVLSAALTRALREELIVRNVARLVELPRVAPRRHTSLDSSRSTPVPGGGQERSAVCGVLAPHPLWLAARRSPRTVLGRH